MVRDKHLGAVGIELAVDGCGMREQSERRLGGFLLACVVVQRRAGLLHKPVAYLERFVGEVARLPDGETARVTVPVVVCSTHVAHVVDLLTGVVLVNILAVALEIVTTIFDAP